MKLGFSRSATFVTLTSVLFLTFACNQKPAQQATQQPPPPPPKPAPSVPNIKVTPAVKAKAEAPKPGPKATKKKVADTFGKGKASVQVKGHPGGVQHSFWSEELAVDASGNPVQVDEVWDNHHKVLYMSNDRSFSCGNGQSATGSTLMTIYGKGNTLHKAPGSGWWLTDLDAGACGVKSADLYGCRFDADGNNTECGAGTIQSDADDVTITPLPGAPQGSSGKTSPAPSAPAATPAPGSTGSKPSTPSNPKQ